MKCRQVQKEGEGLSKERERTLRSKRKKVNKRERDK